MTSHRHALRAVLCLSVMLLLASALAFAQEDTAAETETAPLPEPWPADTALDELSNESWNFSVLVPAGGTLLSEEEVGIEQSEDPMAYPLIWSPGDAPVVLDLIMLGCYDTGAAVDETTFQEILDEENYNVGIDFPRMVMEPQDLELAGGYYTIVTMANDDQDMEVTKFSTYGDNVYYSLSFVYPPDVDPDTVLSQMFAIAETFGPYYYEDEEF